jgi:hypothetical protein
VDLTPVSGLVFVKVPAGNSVDGGSAAIASATFVKGKGFVPLTTLRGLPLGSEVDARRGTVEVTTASATHGKLQSGTFAGGLFRVTQERSGIDKGLTTLSLLEGAFPGAPSYARCRSATRAAVDPAAHAAAISQRILQTLRASDRHGSFRTRGRYSAATVRGTVWETIDRCDGTLTIVRRGTVTVTDLIRHVTITVRAGQRYLARPRRA